MQTVNNPMVKYLICGALHDLVAFVQFKKCEKHPWRSVNFSTKIHTPLWVFFTFFKLYKCNQIAQRITYTQSEVVCPFQARETRDQIYTHKIISYPIVNLEDVFFQTEFLRKTCLATLYLHVHETSYCKFLD